jgi:hypothetical protein
MVISGKAGITIANDVRGAVDGWNLQYTWAVTKYLYNRRDNDSLIHSCALTNDKSYFDRQNIKKNLEIISYVLRI